MRNPRLILDPEACAYHCITRCAGQAWLFDTPAKRSRIQRIIFAAAELRGVELINYSILSNHLHILARIPRQNSLTPLSKDNIIRCAKVLYRADWVSDLESEFASAEKLDSKRSDNYHSQKILDRFEQKRADRSEFMKEVKERITRYINKEHKRKGTLWDGRFKSVVVENTPRALLAVSTYIDLNAVRAGIVDRPEDYRWCGYAAALGGDSKARSGLASIYGHRGGSKDISWSSIAADYRQFLYENGQQQQAEPSRGIKARRGITEASVHKEISRRGRLPIHEVMHYRVRYFTDGVIIGSREFVDQVFDDHRGGLTAPNSQRETGARPMRWANWSGLCSLRDLRLHVISQLH